MEQDKQKQQNNQTQGNNGSSVNTIAIGAVLAVLFLALGVGIGYMIFSGSSAPGEPAGSTAIEELHNSSVVSNVNAEVAGTITEINGRNISLERDGDKMTIAITEDEPVIGKIINPNSEDPEAPQGTTYQNIDFSQLRTGDPVSISTIVKVDGTLLGKSISVLEDESMLP